MKKEVQLDDIYINPTHFHNPVSQQTFDSLPRIYGTIKHRIYSNKLKFYEMINKSFKHKGQHTKEEKEFIINKSGNRVKTEKSESKADSDHKKDQKNALFKEKPGKQLHLKKKKLIQDGLSPKANYVKKTSISDHQSKHKVKFNTLKLHPVLSSSTKGGKPQTLSEVMQDKIFKSVAVNTPLVNLYKSKNTRLNLFTEGIKQESKEESPLYSPQKRYIPKQLIKNFRSKTQEEQDINQKQQILYQNLKTQKSSPKISPLAKNNAKETEFSRKVAQHNFSKMSKFFAIGEDKKFRIPTKDEYKEFIKSYNPVNTNFNLKKLFEKQQSQIVATDKTVYFGEFTDQMHGFGLIITPEYVFQGTFSDGKMVQGSELTYDGIYTGSYANNLREGKGRFQWNNGEVYEGEWKAGRKHGYGIWRIFNGDSYEGQWANGRQEGNGVRKHKNNIQKGQLLNSLKHCKGEQYFQNGDHYQGCYQKGKPNGFGRYTWKDGSYYQGDFVQGYREGKGELHQKNGSIYKGCFRRDFKHGMGQQIQKSGQIRSGIFNQGEYIVEI